MTKEDIVKVFSHQHPEAPTLTRRALESTISQWIVESFTNAHSNIVSRKALGLEPKQSEIATRDALSPYLGSSKAIADLIQPASPPQASDPSRMTFSEYASHRSTQQPYNRTDYYHVGRGLFDQ